MHCLLMHGILDLKICLDLCVHFIIFYELPYLLVFGTYVFPFLFHKGQASYLDYNAIWLQVVQQEEDILISGNVIANINAS